MAGLLLLPGGSALPCDGMPGALDCPEAVFVPDRSGWGNMGAPWRICSSGSISTPTSGVTPPASRSWATIPSGPQSTSSSTSPPSTPSLPWPPSALAAKEITSVDVISGGRLTLGIGVGGEYPKEFQAVGVPVQERGARTDEAIQVLRRLWTEENVSFDGRFTKLDGVTLQPKPAQRGGGPPPAPAPAAWRISRRPGRATSCSCPSRRRSRTSCPTWSATPLRSCRA